MTIKKVFSRRNRADVHMKTQWLRPAVYTGFVQAQTRSKVMMRSGGEHKIPFLSKDLLAFDNC